MECRPLIKFLFISPFTTFVTHWERLSISRGRKNSGGIVTEWRDKSYSSCLVCGNANCVTKTWISGSHHMLSERDRCSKVSHATQVLSVWCTAWTPFHCTQSATSKCLRVQLCLSYSLAGSYIPCSQPCGLSLLQWEKTLPKILASSGKSCVFLSTQWAPTA